MTDIKNYMRQLGRQARDASRIMAQAPTARKNAALLAIADAVEQGRAQVLAANQKDLAAGTRNNLDLALMDRLELTAARLDDMLEGLHQVAGLEDPVGAVTDLRYRPSGIRVGKMRVPLGVIGIIYESRPNVTCEAASLCLKSGNASILRGGSEAINSNLALAACLGAGLESAGLPVHAVQIINTPDRDAVGELITMQDQIDVIIPRGGKSLIDRVSRDASVPVIKHLDGNCHIYIDTQVDIPQALAITVNAKTQRYGTCNTLESLLVARPIAAEVLPALARELTPHKVEIRGCPETCLLLPTAVAATEQDWFAEYLAPILSVKVVAGIDQAIAHINHYGSAHTDAIMTTSHDHAQRFLREVDSSSVMVNASTRFADGFEYGLGAEIGISTNKLHARGPVGLEGLTSQKYIVLGDGEIRE